MTEPYLEPTSESTPPNGEAVSIARRFFIATVESLALARVVDVLGQQLEIPGADGAATTLTKGALALGTVAVVTAITERRGRDT